MKKQKGILKKLGAFTLALAVLGSTLWQYPGTVSAAEEELEQTVNAENTEETEAVCICDSPCALDSVRGDCPVCGTDGADLSLCAGNVQKSDSGKEELPDQSAEEPEKIPSEEMKPEEKEAKAAAEETQMQAEEANEEGKIQELPAESISWNDGTLPDSDELLAGYLQQQMYAGRNDGITVLGDFGRQELTGVNLKIYEGLKREIARIASGARSSTVIEIPVADLGLTKTRWTAEELGVTTTDELLAAVQEETGLDIFLATDYLLVDCPYELYWYNKTAGGGVRMSSGIYYTPGLAPDSWVELRGPLTYSFSVATEYQTSGGDRYTVDTAKTSAVRNAVDCAQQIVADNAAKTDYEKLLAYKNEICRLVSYNHSAAENPNTPYGNPWQLIWVFDGDSGTNVVCEGYAKAFQYLCDLTAFTGSISCYTVTGTMGGGTGAGGHMWNIVTMEDGKNYIVDVTNCDTGTVGADDGLFLNGLSGSWDTQYIYRRGGSSVWYVYDPDAVNMYGESILTLSSERYSLPEPVVTISGQNTVSYGDTLTLSAQVSGTSETATYEWFQGEQKITGQTGAVCVISGLNAGETPYAFRVEATVGEKVLESEIFYVTVNKAQPSCTVPTGLKAVYGQKLGEIVLPASEGADITPGTWTWDTPEVLVGNVGTHTFSATFTPSDRQNFTTLNQDVQVTVSAAVPELVFAAPVQEYIYTGSQAEIEDPEVTLVNGETYTGVISYSYIEEEDSDRHSGLPSDVGTYTVYAGISAQGNYTAAEASCTLEIKYLDFDGNGILYNGTDSRETWYGQPVDVSADGYLVSDKLTGPYYEQYTIGLPSEDGNVSRTLYFKNTAGQITSGQNVTVGFDVTAPEGQIKLGARWWQEFLSFITFGNYRVNDPQIRIQAEDNSSGVGKDGIRYFVYTGEEPYTDVEALEAADVSWTVYDDGNRPAVTADTKTVIYAKLTDNAGNTSYISSEGIILDTAAPVIGNVEIISGTQNQGEAAFDVNEACAYYYVVLPENMPAPAAASVIATVDKNAPGAEGGTQLEAVTASGSGSVTDSMLTDGKGSAKITITGLQANTAYYVYIVAVDRVLDISSSFSGIESGNASGVSSCRLKTGMTDISAAELKLKGQAVYGNTLEAQIDWTTISDPGTLTYRWYRGDAEITGVSGETYVLDREDIGQTIRVEVTAENCYGTLRAAIGESENGADRVEKADCPEVNEALDGTVDDTKGIDVFRFTGRAGVLYEYSLDGGNSWTDVTDGMTEEAGEILTGTIPIGNVVYAEGVVQVRARETDVYKAGRVISNTTAFTASLDGTVVLSGNAVYGDTLTAQASGTQDDTELTYSFYRDGVSEAVQTGTGTEYILTEGDIGREIYVKVTAQGYTGELVSGHTAAVEKRPVTIMADSLTKVYGETDPELTYTISSDTPLAGGDVLSGTLVREEGEDVSEYRIGQGSLTEENNPCYRISFTEGLLKIRPLALDWDVSELFALDKETGIENGKATLYGSLKVSGILPADREDVIFTCPADVLSGVYASVDAGRQRVTLTWADAERPAELEGEKAGNYILPASLPQITGTIHEVITDLPLLPESTATQQYRLEVEIGISEVPDALRKTEDLNTQDKIDRQMRLAIQNQTGDIEPGNIVVYDISLWTNVNNTGWVKVEDEDFPEDGITVTLPYPSGTGEATHDFTAAHMLTVDRDGLKAGDVEYPSVTKTEEGIRFRLMSLSPVSVGWKEVSKETDENTGDGNGTQNNSGNNSGNVTAGPSPSDRPASALTGDDSPIALYVILTAAAALGIGVILVFIKKKRK